MPFYSTKTYGHDVGLSAVFRQHKATHSHCSKLHGYALAVKLTFGCDKLDERNWVMDFGALKEVKQFLQDRFDHKVVVADDDPALQSLFDLQNFGLLDLVILPGVGCEQFASYIFHWVRGWIAAEKEKGVINQTVWLESVEVMEHGANSAIYRREPKELGEFKMMMSQFESHLKEIKQFGEEFTADITALMKEIK